MNNFDKFNFDITKYSNIELKEILDLNNVTDFSLLRKPLKYDNEICLHVHMVYIFYDSIYEKLLVLHIFYYLIN